MASAMPQTTLRPLFNNQTLNTKTAARFLHKLQIIKKPQIYGFYTNSRLTIFTHNFTFSLYSPPSFCSSLSLSFPSLCSLFPSRFRPSFSSMTDPSNPQAQNGSDPPQISSKTVRVVVKGRVQGVFYRNWTIANANQLGLKGWVRNRRDGSVEALFSGDYDKVQEMEQRCCRGPPDAMVTGLQVFPCDDDPGTGFHRKTTV